MLTTADVAAAEAAELRQSRSWLRGLLVPKVVFGLAIVVFFILLAVFGPWLDHTSPDTTSAVTLRPPSLSHWLGTTQQGQDVLAQVIYGARISMEVGLGAGVLTTLWSVLVGLTGGYLAGVGSELLSMFSNVFLVIPSLPLVVILAAYLPNSGSFGVILVITATGWAWGARVLRAQTLSLRRRDFVEAARATGESSVKIMLYDILPNALNPVLTLGSQMDDVLRAHRPGMKKVERAARTRELLQLVGISPDRAGAYPHELSGGMRQRAMIAMGLALDPEIIVMDEPTTALDVVIQRQVIETIGRLKDRLGFSVIFITHDLSLLIELCDTIAIMYAGQIVELAPADQLYRRPLHPYSQGLLGSFPTLTGPRRTLTGVPGYPPDLRRRPPGCQFQPRCPKAFEACTTTLPLLTRREDADVACFLYDEATVGGDRG